jgi:hypothetical protein
VGFKIETKGLDDIQKMIKDIGKSIDPNTFTDWTDRVGRTAKQICNDPDCKRIKINKIAPGKVNFEFADKEAIDCVNQSIQSHLHSMPPIIQEEFKLMMDEFEKRRIQY